MRRFCLAASTSSRLAQSLAFRRRRERLCSYSLVSVDQGRYDTDMPEAQRFEDPGTTIYTFLNEPFLVECPRCRQCARVANEKRTAPTVTCLQCGYAKSSVSPTPTMVIPNDRGEPLDPYFRLPLWCQAPVGRHVLWALNSSHLDFLEAYVSATLRQRTHLSSWQNSSLASRLPRWLMAAGHRHAVLSAIGKLRQKST